MLYLKDMWALGSILYKDLNILRTTYFPAFRFSSNYTAPLCAHGRQVCQQAKSWLLTARLHPHESENKIRYFLALHCYRDVPSPLLPSHPLPSSPVLSFLISSSSRLGERIFLMPIV